MKTPIPEDLSDLPDAPADAAPEPELVPGDVPDDLSLLPDGQMPDLAEGEGAAAARRKAPGRLGALVAVALAGLAAVLVVLELGQLAESAFGWHPVLGWVTLGVSAAAIVLVGFIVAREVRGYARLKAFEGLRDACTDLLADPRDPDVEARARDEIRSFIRHMKAAGGPGMLVLLERLEARMDVSESAGEWREEMELILLAPLDEEVRAVIRREAVNVGLGTAISPSGLVDAIIVAWRNIRLVRKIASIYQVRAGTYGTFLIMRRAVAAVAVADLAQEATVALVGTTRSLASLLGRQVAQGLANATMTILVGMRALEECRPLRLPEQERRNTARMLGESVVDGVRRAVPSKPDGTTDGDE